jgi:peptidoglycan hydrolase-like protein with peptidoglycan-binding domain
MNEIWDAFYKDTWSPRPKHCDELPNGFRHSGRHMQQGDIIPESALEDSPEESSDDVGALAATGGAAAAESQVDGPAGGGPSGDASEVEAEHGHESPGTRVPPADALSGAEAVEAEGGRDREAAVAEQPPGEEAVDASETESGAEPNPGEAPGGLRLSPTSDPAPSGPAPAPAPPERAEHVAAPASPAPSGGLLSEEEVSDALEFNRGQVSKPRKIREAQAALGVDVTGRFDVATVQAAAAYQQGEGLTVDGKLGRKTRKLLSRGRGRNKTVAASGSATATDPTVDLIKARFDASLAENILGATAKRDELKRLTADPGAAEAGAAAEGVEAELEQLLSDRMALVEAYETDLVAIARLGESTNVLEMKSAADHELTQVQGGHAPLRRWVKRKALRKATDEGMKKQLAAEITASMTGFKQYDKEWANKGYGKGKRSDMKENGCLPSSAAMSLNFHLQERPENLADGSYADVFKPYDDSFAEFWVEKQLSTEERKELKLRGKDRAWKWEDAAGGVPVADGAKSGAHLVKSLGATSARDLAEQDADGKGKIEAAFPGMEMVKVARDEVESELQEGNVVIVNRVGVHYLVLTGVRVDPRSGEHTYTTADPGSDAKQLSSKGVDEYTRKDKETTRGNEFWVIRPKR